MVHWRTDWFGRTVGLERDPAFGWRPGIAHLEDALMPVRAWLLAGLLLAVGCSSGTEDINRNNRYDNAGFPVPDSVLVAVGSNVVRLDWSVDSPGSVTQYTVFRRRTDTDPPEQERVIATLSSRTYTDYGVRDGRTYLYRIAAGKDGRFG